MSENNQNKFFNARMSSGWQRVLITIFGTIINLSFLYIGYLVIKSGVTGSWEIVSSFQGFKLYAASISPGLFIIICGTFIFIYLLKIAPTLK